MNFKVLYEQLSEATGEIHVWPDPSTVEVLHIGAEMGKDVERKMPWPILIYYRSNLSWVLEEKSRKTLSPGFTP
jgi:hypothetical protein